MLLPPHYLDAVVAIGTEASKGQRRWIGTGFFFVQMTTKGEGLPCLVTNKHVIAGLDSVYVRANPVAGGPAREFELLLRGGNGEPYWFVHPDPEIDIALTPVKPESLNEIGLSFYIFRSDSDVATLDTVRASKVSEGDDVFVLGFPMWNIGGERSAVIARKGCIARIQDTLAGESSTFLIDASVYPGNSGGPVILRPQIASEQPTPPPLNIALLLGVVAEYVPYHDTAVSLQTGRPRVVFEENSGIGSVYPIDYVIQTIAAVVTGTPSGELTPAPKKGIRVSDSSSA